MASQSNIPKIIPLDYIQSAINNPLFNQKCADLHRGLTCNQKFFSQINKGFQGVFKMYLIVHLVPFVLFKIKKTRKNPQKEIYKFIVGLLRSLCFGTLYIAVLRRTLCFLTKYYKFQGTLGTIIPGFVGGISLIFETPTRQSEIALFTLNKAFQSLYGMAMTRKYPVRIPYGEILVMGLATAIYSYYYMNSRECFRSTYLSVLDRLLGKI